MKMLLAPDSFKGSLSAKEVAESLEKGLKGHLPSLTIEKLPLGDGGEGTLDALISSGLYGREQWLFNDPIVGQRRVEVGVSKRQVYLESASVLGLPWFEAQGIPFGKRNSRALGVLMKQALEKGYSSFQIGLGGTGCHDWGLGLAFELGVRFFDREGYSLDEPWSDPKLIYDFEVPEFEMNITSLSDIDAPLTGKMGAAFCYAGQKGATDLEGLEETANRLIEVVKRSTGINLTDLKGGGAAGGLGFGLAAFFKTEITSGIQTVAENLQLEKLIAESDIIITGEGKIDGQSFDGKVLSGVLALAKKYRKPMILVCGRNEVRRDLPQEIVGVFDTSKYSKTAEESIAFAGSIMANHLSVDIIKTLGH